MTIYRLYQRTQLSPSWIYKYKRQVVVDQDSLLEEKKKLVSDAIAYAEAMAAEQRRLSGLMSDFSTGGTGAKWAAQASKSKVAGPAVGAAGAAFDFLQGKAEDNALSWQDRAIELLKLKNRITEEQLRLSRLPGTTIDYDLQKKLGINIPDEEKEVEEPAEHIANWQDLPKPQWTPREPVRDFVIHDYFGPNSGLTGPPATPSKRLASDPLPPSRD